MATYLILNCIMCLALMAVFRPSVHRLPAAQKYTLIALLVLTAIFDNLLIIYGVIDYNSTKLLGLYIGKAPIEDFFYAVVAAMVVPLVWRRFNRDKKE